MAPRYTSEVGVPRTAIRTLGALPGKVMSMNLFAATSVALLLALPGPHSAVPASSAPLMAAEDDAAAAAKSAKLNEHFDALKAALAQAPSALHDALEASVQEEELRRAKSDEGGGNNWRCEDALRSAKTKSMDLRKAARTLVDRAANKWAAAKGTAQGMDPGELPWGPAPEDSKNVNDAIVRLQKFYAMVNSSQSAIGPKRLASIWKSAREYSGGLPKALPSAKAEDMVPDSVDVPCIGRKVSMRP